MGSDRRRRGQRGVTPARALVAALPPQFNTGPWGYQPPSSFPSPKALGALGTPPTGRYNAPLEGALVQEVTPPSQEGLGAFAGASLLALTISFVSPPRMFPLTCIVTPLAEALWI